MSRSPASVVADGAALAAGTLTRVPVPAPRLVDRPAAGVAMTLAPVVGAGLGLVVGAGAQVLVDHTAAGSFLAAALAVATLAYLTRALHLDGLADTADALGSGKPPEQALAIAKRSDIGPFGVVTVVAVLLIQVAALAQALAAGRGVVVLTVALAAGRLAITLGCVRGVPAARPDGLGAAVAGSVPRWVLAATTLAVAAGAAAVTALTASTGEGVAGPAVAGAVAVAGGLLSGAVVLRTCVRRLGGVTGDVLGALAEVGTSTALVLLVVLASA